jgi:heme/copper-type cytochrome/quinol oxidase subunit 3
MAEAILSRPERLIVGPVGKHGTGFNGMVCLIASEAALFGYLLFSYYYICAIEPVGWVLEPEPKLKLALPNTILLLLSSVAGWWADRSVKREEKGRALVGLGVAFVLGLIFAVVQVFEWKARTYGLGVSSYASLYFVTTGFHMAHVIVGLVILALLFLWTAFDFFSPIRRLPVSNGIIYWHLVDAVWIAVFTTYYITPYLEFGT